MPDCGLKVYDGTGSLARELVVQVPDELGPETLDEIQRQGIQSLLCSYAVLERDTRLLALFLHQQLLPLSSVPLSVRRRVSGRWVTAQVPLTSNAGGRAAIGPDVFFRQADIDPGRAWLLPMVLRLSTTVPAHEVEVGDERLWTWSLRGNRYVYAERGSEWRLYGAGSTADARFEAAVAEAGPETVHDYLWAVGAVALGRK